MNRSIFWCTVPVLFWISMFCKAPHETRIFDVDCGECLDLPTGLVCTVDGTMQNSCLAICRGKRILCSGECPCVDEQ